ncbi:succinyl-CoA synthetase, beta subunit [Candidatus Filomicrobium marinum]|uniref:Succinate--CoA ligase [ADP-forming] subunit beta n=2 Tax=Filomicrobium TaxID=119044 RepID=A0A0D6JDV0_9HYPH|nr:MULTISPECIES: malate--CoA ligase subunit beta [Filomicrobium]MCV0368331.1 malate--CoA ligase subunit beta [Filomicrobium sp.]CFX12211.1 succinyl-CoA synthetase, beta subunit [Candidatus Filomicrobium marinum]CPR17410.1 succinyl-CoA synthetase, beta subunit [Candidatus Filomicrobium marinum]SDO34548.1 malate thiokinase large subunit [Filomicrobium insigne]
MDIHEYQAKELLAKFGVPIARGGLAYSPEQATYRANEIGGSVWVVKAQIHSGARGKAGGIKICRTDDEIWEAADSLLGKRLVTNQTGPQGKLVSRLYIEEGTNIAKEYYLSFIMDRGQERIVVVASSSGGMDIEEISEKQPDSILRVVVDPAVGMQGFQARELTFGLGIEPDLVNKFERTILGCYRAFRDLDATLLEINPLVVTGERSLIALDAKMSFDANALFRRPQISELRDKSQEDPRETYASDRGLSYVGLDGDIGCVVNGAGLAMATLDMIKLAGGEPANFLDIGGGASPERVQKSFRAVLKDSNVKALLVNVFAGINRCDWVAKGVVDAITELDIKLPVVVRLAGTNVEEGRKIISESGLSVINADSLRDAAEKAVAAARQSSAAA